MKLAGKKAKIAYRVIALLLAATMFSSDLAPACFVKNEAVEVQAASKLTINNAVNMAYAASLELEDMDMKMETLEAKYSSAIRSLAIKKRQMASFSWSFLLSFHFPETPDEATAYEFTYKPLDLKADIDELNQKIICKKLSIQRDVQDSFVTIYSCQKNIEYYTKRAEKATNAYYRNQGRYILGLASEADVKKYQNKAENLNDKIINEEKNLQKAKKKLSQTIKLDVTTGYTFEEPFVKADIPRSLLPELKQYTLDHEYNYYTTATEATLALTSVKTHYQLFDKHYKSSDMNIIRSYVTNIMNGNKVSKRAFKKDYQRFLKQIDSYWEGSWRIFLFIRIPKKWLKDEEEDGTGYIDEDPEALYSESLDYIEKLEAKNVAKAQLENQVEDYYDNYIEAKKVYERSVKIAAESLAEYEKAIIQNESGMMSLAEFEAFAETSDSAQQTMMENLANYSNMLYMLNELTCGRISQYLTGEDVTLVASEGGKSYITEDIEDGDAYYYIEPIVQESEFVLHVYIPPDYAVNVTHFEMYVGNLQVGTKTAVNDCIRHLKLDLSGGEIVKIRLYDGNTFLNDCAIDPTLYSGPLKVVASRTVSETAKDIGTYTSSTSETTGITSIKLKPGADYEIESYRIKDVNGTYLESDDQIEIDTKFTYLPLLTNSIDKIIVEFYDKDGKKVIEGTLDAGNIKEYKGVN